MNFVSYRPIIAMPCAGAELLTAGTIEMWRFCAANDLPAPAVTAVPREEWKVAPCAYYRPHTGIMVCVEKCARLGRGGPAWSWPGYAVDRTPHGAVLHELGHYADWVRSSPATCGPYWGDLSSMLRAASEEPGLTGYCPDDAEWFAEAFRLFVSNPDLLRLSRPRTYEALREHFEPTTTDPWRVVLERWGASERTLAAAGGRVKSGAGKHRVAAVGPPRPEVVLNV